MVTNVGVSQTLHLEDTLFIFAPLCFNIFGVAMLSFLDLAFPLNFDSSEAAGDGNFEMLHALSLTFKNRDLEEQYLIYRFELAREGLTGKWGTLSLTSLISSVTLALGCIESITSYFKHQPGGRERMLVALPLTLFNFYHQFKVRTGKVKSTDIEIYSRSFVMQWVLLLGITEVLSVVVNDSFPEFEGCPAKRFRCPYTFSSSEAASRGIVIGSVLIFSLTPCSSFMSVLRLVLILCGTSRIFGFFLFQDRLLLSLWSNICVFMQLAIFLICRYVRDLNDRRNYLLQLQITRLRANLQGILDNMIPRQIAERAQVLRVGKIEGERLAHGDGGGDG
jgi:hypothetical protein